MSGTAQAGAAHAAGFDAVADWPAPVPIGDALPPVAPMLPDLIPAALRPLCVDIAELAQAPLDFSAAAAVVSLAGAVNRAAAIQPKVHDTNWIVTPNLWGAIVAPPGAMKSAIVRAITRPLRVIEEKWRAEYHSEMQVYAEEKEEVELKMVAWRQLYTAAQKKPGKDRPPRPDNAAVAPMERRLVVGDARFERLHEILRDNPRGVMVLRDELSGWLAQLDQPGREAERAFCLEAWNGDAAHTVDRIGRGTVHVPHCCFSLLGGIQPGRLRQYLLEALKDGPANDGLAQRFQILVYPDAPESWTNIDRIPDAAAAGAAREVFERLAGMDANEPSLYRFDRGGQELFDAWRITLETRLRNDDLHPAMVAHLAKYRSLMPTLSVLFELADGGTGTVTLGHARQSAAWCSYLETHAARVYCCAVNPALRAAGELARKLSGGWCAEAGTFSPRDVYRRGWVALATPADVRAALEVLEDHGWVRRQNTDPGPLGGRPAEIYAINPRVQR